MWGHKTLHNPPDAHWNNMVRYIHISIYLHISPNEIQAKHWKPVIMVAFCLWFKLASLSWCFLLTGLLDLTNIWPLCSVGITVNMPSFKVEHLIQISFENRILKQFDRVPEEFVSQRPAASNLFPSHFLLPHFFSPLSFKITAIFGPNNVSM